MINAEQMSKIIEDALAKQKENFKFELEMTMMQMKEEHDQQIRALSNQLGESSRCNIDNQSGSDLDVGEHLNEDNPPANQNARSGPTEDDHTKVVPPKMTMSGVVVLFLFQIVRGPTRGRMRK